GLFARLDDGFGRGFEGLRQRYTTALGWALGHRRAVFMAFVLVVASAFALLPFVGRDFFPVVDAGQFRLHVKAPTGTRLEETEVAFGRGEAAIRRIIPAPGMRVVVDNSGVPQ